MKEKILWFAFDNELIRKRGSAPVIGACGAAVGAAACERLLSSKNKMVVVMAGKSTVETDGFASVCDTTCVADEGTLGNVFVAFFGKSCVHPKLKLV